MNKSFCFKPWTELYSHFDKVGPCCVNYEIFKGSLDDYSNSVELKNLRRSFLQGDKPASCKECWETEKAGLQSLRQRDNIRSKDLKTISISLSNKCNFKCRMCNSDDSSAWSKDLDACKIRQVIPTKTIQAFDKVDWILSKCKNTSMNVRVMGGEPFITDEFLHLIKEIDRLDLYDNIYLIITTNLSTLSYKGVDYLTYFDKFKNLDIYASFDGTYSVGEYIRHGFVYDKFVSNLSKAKKYINFLSVTLQLYNILDIPEIKSFADTYNLEIDYCFLTDPDYLRIENLSFDQRKQVLDYYSKVGFKDTQVFSVLNSDIYIPKINTFLEYTQKLDSIWNKNFTQSIPRLAQILS